ncbi:hemin transporter [Chryseotalea sanaruensis]|uniref:Hemin transporter n=1 Tax=Chryseotalea sanaruensis TaxID=2482724 RepID=A0A401U5P6_9BACT|nr:globin [Chryseotalea sanaruensis]GCC50248.1 hemin transporter [Chryseotalea sanaruensis]
MEQTFFDKIGEENITLLVTRFYDLVFEDKTIAPLFKTDKELIKEKQRMFLTQFFGGPSLYSDVYGHPKMRARHMPHPIGGKEAEAWLSCMSQAINTLPIEEKIKQDMMQRLIPTAMFMVNKE